MSDYVWVNVPDTKMCFCKGHDVGLLSVCITISVNVVESQYHSINQKRKSYSTRMYSLYTSNLFVITDNNYPTGCEAQLACRFLFTSTFFGGGGCDQ